jgi:hypothetical protein
LSSGTSGFGESGTGIEAHSINGEVVASAAAALAVKVIDHKAAERAP